MHRIIHFLVHLREIIYKYLSRAAVAAATTPTRHQEQHYNNNEQKRTHF